MNFKYIYIWIIIPLLISKIVNGQNKITIGQKCPDAYLKMFNYTDSTVRLSDFNKKLIIIDFWATYCGSCVKKLKDLDKIQKEFEGKIMILPVATQSLEAISEFWIKNPNTKNLRLPTVVDDQTLKKFFPHKYTPHEVWINADGLVIAITNAEYVTSVNIKTALEGKINFPIKDDVDYTFSNSFYTLNDSYEKGASSLFHSGLSSHLKGVQQTVELRFDTTGHTVRAYIINNNILDLYNKTIENTDIDHKKNRVILETIDSSRFFVKKRESYYNKWLEDNTYCYETVFPLGTNINEVRRDMRSDLNRYLRLNGRVESKHLKCWVLKNLSRDKIKMKLKNSNLTIEGMITQLNNFKGFPPIVGESSLSKQTISSASYKKMLNNQTPDLELINNEMKKYNLYFEKQDRTIDFLIISDMNLRIHEALKKDMNPEVSIL
jgi:thiol-disulfide isomerase/thioredoxin